MSKELIIGLSAGGGGFGSVIILLLLYKLIILGHKSKVNLTSKEVLNQTKLEHTITILLANKNTMSVPAEARASLEVLQQIRTDNTDKVAIEAQKAKALRKAIKPKALSRTKNAKLV